MPASPKQLLLFQERPPSRELLRVTARGAATLPRDVASVPLPLRKGPYLPVWRGKMSPAKMQERLIPLLPVGAQPAKKRALERQVWGALVRRCESEAEELEALGLCEKAALWRDELERARLTRQQAVEDRRDAFKMYQYKQSQETAKNFPEAKRLRQMLIGNARA